MTEHDSIDRKILVALKDGPLTGTKLVSRCYRGHYGIARIHNVSTEVFCAHLDGLLRKGVITCTKLGDPAHGEWSLTPRSV